MSDAKDRANERGKDVGDADFPGMIVQAVLGQAADHDARILPEIAKNPSRSAWTAWAPADQPRERRREVVIEILSDKAFAVAEESGHNIQKIKDAFGRGFKHTHNRNGTIGGRLYERVADFFFQWPPDTAECECSNNKLREETTRKPSISHTLLGSRFSLKEQMTLKVAAMAHENPTSKLRRTTRLATRLTQVEGNGR